MKSITIPVFCFVFVLSLGFLAYSGTLPEKEVDAPSNKVIYKNSTDKRNVIDVTVQVTVAEVCILPAGGERFSGILKLEDETGTPVMTESMPGGTQAFTFSVRSGWKIRFLCETGDCPATLGACTYIISTP